MMENSKTNRISNRLMLLVTVVPKKKNDSYRDLLQSFEVNMQASVLAKGTAGDNLQAYFALKESDRVVNFCVIREDRCKEALYAIEERFNSVKNGKGIAFTIPFSSMIGVLGYSFLSNNRDAVKENG